jgi:hypothetical protein
MARLLHSGNKTCSAGRRVIMKKLRIFGAVVVLATTSLSFATSTYAQTNGMERRDDRQDDRQTARGA